MIEMEECAGIDYANLRYRLYTLEERCTDLESELRLVKEKIGIKCSNQREVTMAGLKPCPFCGGKADYYCEEYDSADKGYNVECEKCEARTATYDTPEQAIDAWNKRS